MTISSDEFNVRMILRPRNIPFEDIEILEGDILALTAAVRAEAALAERDACAKVVEERFAEGGQYEWAGRQCAAAIRARNPMSQDEKHPDETPDLLPYKALRTDLSRRTHERNYAQRECEACAETARDALSSAPDPAETMLAKCEAIAREAAATAKERASLSRTVREREAWTEQKIAGLNIAGLLAALKGNGQ